MNDRFALQVQSLSSAPDKVLAVADLVRQRSEDHRFAVGDLTAAFYGLNVPPPSNVSAALGKLKQQDRAIRHTDGRWALTPIGEQALTALAVESAARVTTASTSTPGASFAHVDHTVIPSWAAPPRWSAGIARLLERHPFDANVLCMTRFPSEGGVPDPVKHAIEVAKSVLADHGLTLHLASDAIVDEDLLGNVGAYMWACRYGLGIVEDRVGRGLNYNAMIELGGMTLMGRRCAILKGSTIPALPTDLSGQIYKGVDLSDENSVASEVQFWVEHDLGLPPKGS